MNTLHTIPSVDFSQAAIAAEMQAQVLAYMQDLTATANWVLLALDREALNECFVFMNTSTGMLDVLWGSSDFEYSFYASCPALEVVQPWGTAEQIKQALSDLEVAYKGGRVEALLSAHLSA